MSLMISEPETRVAWSAPLDSGMAAKRSAAEGVVPSMPSWRILALSELAAFQASYVADHDS